MQFVAIFLLGLVSVFAAAYGPVVSDGVASTAGDTTASTTISATSTFVEAVFFGGPAFTIKTWGRWLTLETSVSGPETVYGPTSTVYVTENACPVMNRLDRRTEGVASAGTTSMTIAKILSAEGVAPVAAASDIAGQTPSVEGVAHLQGTTTVYACPAESRARRQADATAPYEIAETTRGATSGFPTKPVVPTGQRIPDESQTTATPEKNEPEGFEDEEVIGLPVQAPMQTQDAEDPSQTLEEDEPTRTLRNENGVADIPLTTIARNTGVPYNLPGSDFWEELFHTGEHQFDDDTSSAMITPAPEISGQTTLAALSESTTPGQVLSKDDFAGPGRIEGATFASPGDFSSLRSRASPLASAGSTQEVVTIRLPPVTSYVGPPKKSAPANWWDGAEEVGWTTGQNCATTTVVRPTPAVYMSCVPWMYPPTTNESQASSVISLEFRRLVVDWVVFFARIGCFGLAIWFCFTQEWMYLATSVIYYVFLSIPVLDNAIKLGFCFLSFLVLQIIVGVYGTILIYYDYNY